MGLDYIRSHPEIRDVIISGGDSLMLTDRKIEYIVGSLRAIEHLEIIRIGSRVPVTLPQRITPELCAILKQYHPFYINTHFNHPREVTPETEKACGMLVDAGIPVGNQAVLLRGVNDDPAVMVDLMKKLLKIRVRPYYIYQADLVYGTDHFRTSIKKGSGNCLGVTRAYLWTRCAALRGGCPRRRRQNRTHPGSNRVL